jgi:MerC mercury resistance protein
MPFIVGLLPLLGLSLFADARAEWMFVGVSIAVGVLSLLPSYLRRHRQFRPLAIFSLGLCLILIARLILDGSLALEIPIVVVGAMCVAIAHLLNRRLCQACEVCASSCGEQIPS